MTDQPIERLLRIPIEQIGFPDRARKNMGDVQDLADDIIAIGQIQPGVVRRSVPDDVQKFDVDPAKTPWLLVAGGRRYAAVCLAGIDTYLAVDRGVMTPLMQAIYELHENLKRKDLDWDEEVFLKEKIHNLRKQEAESRGETWSQTDTGKEVGESVANISRDLALAQELRANPELRNAPSKISAVRQIKYDKAIEDRSNRVNQTNLRKASDRLVTAKMEDYARGLATHSIDLNFTDFPFGIEYNFNPADRNKYEDQKDRLQNLLTDIIPQMFRTTKPTGWLALMMGSTNYEMLCDLVKSCCAEHFEYADVKYEEGSDGVWRRHRKNRCNSTVAGNASPCRFVEPEDPEWIWYRPNSRNPSMFPELHAQNQFEKICVVNMGQAVMVKKNLGNVLNHDAIYTDRIHEMQRPHGLCLDVVSRLTLGGEVVSDWCFGSGSALAAAAELERDYHGCDMNPACLTPALVWVSEHLPVRR